MADPRADRPHIPGYGVPKTLKGLLPWSWARERLEAAMIYRFATASAGGRPHVIPIWGAWAGDAWYVDGGPTRWKRNLNENPQIAIEIGDGTEVVMVEGNAEEARPSTGDEIAAVVAGYQKYADAGIYEVDPANWSQGGLWRMRPKLAIAWSKFPKDMTRFRF
ncbi:MAG: pyridoxamine 5'-phosphate oxidase family protein [Chloroflexi bacterium]|nr:pyridoxamine 5'-phosphate oxidase family protein [Chloroflexota bacterium]